MIYEKDKTVMYDKEDEEDNIPPSKKTITYNRIVSPLNTAIFAVACPMLLFSPLISLGLFVVLGIQMIKTKEDKKEENFWKEERKKYPKKKSKHNQYEMKLYRGL